MARAVELHVTVLSANGLMSDGGSWPVNVYCLLWIDPAWKLSTRVHVGGGRFPLWNDEMVFDLGEEGLQLPNSAITITVVNEGLVQNAGSWRSSLLGTAYLPLPEIARRMAMRENPEDRDIVVQLQLTTPGTTPASDLRGSISLAISLISDSSQRSGSSSLAPLLPNQSALVTGYPVGLLLPTPYDQECFSAYRQTPQLYGPFLDQATRRQSRKSIVFAAIGGAIAGFVIRDIIGVFFP